MSGWWALNVCGDLSLNISCVSISPMGIANSHCWERGEEGGGTGRRTGPSSQCGALPFPAFTFLLPPSPFHVCATPFPNFYTPPLLPFSYLSLYVCAFVRLCFLPFWHVACFFLRMAAWQHFCRCAAHAAHNGMADKRSWLAPTCNILPFRHGAHTTTLPGSKHPLPAPLLPSACAFCV